MLPVSGAVGVHTTGERATAGWDPGAGFAAYRERMRDYVEANQEIGRMHVQMLTATEPAGDDAAEPDMEAMTALIERAVNGPELPDYP